MRVVPSTSYTRLVSDSLAIETSLGYGTPSKGSCDGDGPLVRSAVVGGRLEAGARKEQEGTRSTLRFQECL